MAYEEDEVVIAERSLDRVVVDQFDTIANKVTYPFIEPVLIGQVTENICMNIDENDDTGLYFVPANNIIVDEESGLGDKYEILGSAVGLSRFAGELIEADDSELDRVTELYIASGIARLILPIRLQLLQRLQHGKSSELAGKINDFLLEKSVVDDWNMFTNGNYNLPVDQVHTAQAFFEKLDDDRLRVFNMSRAVIGMAFYALSDDKESNDVQQQLRASWRTRTAAGFREVNKVVNVGAAFLGVPGVKTTMDTVLYNAADHFPILPFAGMTALTGAEIMNNFVVADYSEYNIDD